MNSTAVFSDTEINQAKLISKLSNKPAKVANDVFIWNGVLIDRASAIVHVLCDYLSENLFSCLQTENLHGKCHSYLLKSRVIQGTVLSVFP